MGGLPGEDPSKVLTGTPLMLIQPVGIRVYYPCRASPRLTPAEAGED